MSYRLLILEEVNYRIFRHLFCIWHQVKWVKSGPSCNFSLFTLTKCTYIIMNEKHKSGKFSLHHERHVPIWCLCVRLYERERERERERGYVNPFNEQPLIFLVRSNRKN